MDDPQHEPRQDIPHGVRRRPVMESLRCGLPLLTTNRGADEGVQPSDGLHCVDGAMSDGRTWEGHWRVRLYERLRERGFASLTAFAEARPAIPLHELAAELGEKDVAGVQVLSGLRFEAEQRKQVTRFVRDVLVRMLAQSLPGGWPTVMDDANRFKVAKALGAWFGYTPESHELRAEQVMAALRATPPPPGWRPLGPDDALLRMLLPDEDA